MTNNVRTLELSLQRLAYLKRRSIDTSRLAESINIESKRDFDSSELIEAVFHRLNLPPPVPVFNIAGANFPLLAFGPDKKWCVLEEIDEQGHCQIYKSGSIEKSELKDLRSQVFEIELEADREDSKANNENNVVDQGFRDYLYKCLKEHRGSIIEVGLASLFIGFLALATSLFSMQVYDRVIPTKSEHTLVVMSIGVGICILVELVMKFIRSALLDQVVIKLDANLAREVFHQLLKIRVDQIPASVGGLAAQLRGYEQIRGFYTSSTLFVLVDFPIALTFLFIVAFLATPYISLTILGFAVFALLIGLMVRKRVQQLAGSTVAYSNMKTGLLVEAVEGAETIKAGNGGWKFLSRWVGVNDRAIEVDQRMRHTNDGAGYIAGSLQQLSYASLIIVGAHSVIKGEITMGALIACSILSGRILAPIMAIPNLIVQHAHAKAAIEGLEKLYKLKADNHGVRRPLAPDVVDGFFQFKDVKFCYAEAMPVLNIPVLNVRKGERIAIIGPIGAGKSTLLRLMSGLYTPTEGTVLLDGLDLSFISRNVLSRKIGYLQQDHRLFQGTIRENLLIGLPDPGDAVLLNVLKRTGMDRVVSSHPKGLERMIVEGGKGLSGGQRQLLAFTRLFLLNADILLLDEPTATMDSEQEQRCLQILSEEAKKQRTMVIVTHKPSLLPLVTRIIVVAGSGVVLDGERDAVLARIKNSGHAHSEFAQQAKSI